MKSILCHFEYFNYKEQEIIQIVIKSINYFQSFIHSYLCFGESISNTFYDFLWQINYFNLLMNCFNCQKYDLPYYFNVKLLHYNY